jgi:MFS family permease
MPLTAQRLRPALLPWVIALVTALDYFDSAIFSFFVRAIADGVHASLTEFVWVASGYAVAAVLGILQQEWWVERLGQRRYIAGCLALYAVGGVLAALSHTPLELFLARSLQGYFIGPMMGACRILIQRDFVAAARPKALRAFLVMIFLGGACAPLAGGWLVTHFGWRGLFACTVPVALLLVTATLFALPNTGNRQPEQRGAAHLWPYMLFAFGQAALQIVLMKARSEQLTGSPTVLMLALLGIAALLWFGYHQWHHPAPLIRLHALRERRFLIGLVLFLFYYFLSTGFSYLLPRMLEDGHGYSIEKTGYLIGLPSLLAAIALFIWFRFSRRIKRKKFVIVPGFLLALVAALWIAMAPPDAGVTALLGPMLLRGLLVIFIILPVANLAFNIFTDDEFAHGYRLKNIVRQMAMSLATASILILEQHRLALHQSVAVAQETLRNPLFGPALQALVRDFSAAGNSVTEAHALALVRLAPDMARHAQFQALVDGFYFLAAIAVVGALFAARQRQID